MKSSRTSVAFPCSGAATVILTSFAAAGVLLPLSAFAQTSGEAVPALPADLPVKSLGMVTINSGQPTSLPTQIPTSIEGVTREQIEQTINATDSR